jgi:predicted nucleic acid-binding protein
VALDLWDTSSVAKLYLNERGSEWASIRAREHSVAHSRLVVPEFASVLARRVAIGEIASADRDRLHSEYLADAAKFEIIELTEELMTRAVQLVLGGTFGTRVRAGDAIHLATAQWWFEQTRRLNMEPGAFIVADRPLREAAVALGLAVDNPEEHE